MAMGPERGYLNTARTDVGQIDVGLRRYMLSVRERRRSLEGAAPPVVEELERQPGVVAVDWQAIT